MIRALMASLGILAFVAVQGHALTRSSGASELVVLAQQSDQPSTTPPSYSEVSAVLADSCILCHAPPSPAGGLNLNSHAGLMKGGRSGPAVLPGDPDKSEIIRRLRGLSEPRMPMSGPPWLSDEKVMLIEQWIKAGAKNGGEPMSQRQSTSELPPTAQDTPQPVRYGQVAPIFDARCVKCHAAKGQLGPPPEGIRMDSYEMVIKGGERPIVVPGLPGASPLVRSVLGQSRPRMPMDGPPYLDAPETDLISLWVKEGARSDSDAVAPLPVGARIRLGGTLTDRWSLDGTAFTVDGKTRIRKKPVIGAYVQVRAVLTESGGIHATEIRTR